LQVKKFHVKKSHAKQVTFCSESTILPWVGLVGGSVPVHDEIVMSMARADNIISFDQVRLRV